MVNIPSHPIIVVITLGMIGLLVYISVTVAEEVPSVTSGIHGTIYRIHERHLQ